MTQDYDKYNPYAVQLFLRKTYLPKIEDLLRQKDSQKTENLIKEEARKIIDVFFTLVEGSYADYSKIFLEWYMAGSFENDPIENIPKRMEYLWKYKDRFNETDHGKYPTYQDYLKNHEMEFFHIDINKNLKNSFKTIINDESIFKKLKHIFRFCESILSIKKDKITLSFKNFDDIKKFGHMREISVFYNTIPDPKKEILNQEIMTLKEMMFIHSTNYIEREDHIKKIKDYAQKIFDEHLWTLFQEKKFFKDFSDLNKTLQNKILQQIESYKTLEKKIDVVTNLFQIDCIIKLGDLKKFELEIKTHNPILPEELKKIEHFLKTPEIPFEESYITPEEYTWGIKSKNPLVLRSFAHSITAHEKIKLKKLFLSL